MTAGRTSRTFGWRVTSIIDAQVVRLDGTLVPGIPVAVEIRREPFTRSVEPLSLMGGRDVATFRNGFPAPPSVRRGSAGRRAAGWGIDTSAGLVPPLLTVPLAPNGISLRI